MSYRRSGWFAELAGVAARANAPSKLWVEWAFLAKLAAGDVKS